MGLLIFASFNKQEKTKPNAVSLLEQQCKYNLNIFEQTDNLYELATLDKEREILRLVNMVSFT